MNSTHFHMEQGQAYYYATALHKNKIPTISRQ